MKKTTLLSLVTTTALASTLSGCSYLDRYEGVSSFAGDAIAINNANMVVDPWPEQFDDTDIDADGERMTTAVEKYKQGGAQTASSSPAPVIITPKN